MMQQQMPQQDHLGAQQILHTQLQQQLVQPQPTMIQSQPTMVQPQNGTMQPQPNIIQQHNLIQTQHGMAQGQNPTMQTQQGILQAQHGMVQPQMVQHHGLIQPQLMPQQMMLCPLRVVYDTPVLMQSGDQIQQQNQNFFINPQSTPPWARPIQNQFIYVQQMPSNNLVPVQQLDPNQVYIQQNFPFHQVIPQMIQNQDQIRMVQNLVPNSMLPNNVQNNMVPNNVSGMNNVPNTMVNNTVQGAQNNVGNVIPNSAPNNAIANNNRTQNSVVTLNNIQPTNTSVSQVVTNILPNTVTYSMQGNVQSVQNAATTMQNQRPMQPNSEVNVANTNQQQMVTNDNRQVINQNMTTNQKSVGMQTNVYRNPPTNTVRAQLTTQNFNQNVQLQQQNVHRQTAPNQMNQQNMINNMVAATQANTDNTVTFSAVRNGTPYTFRAIQPKPPQYRQFTPMTQMQRPYLAPKYTTPNAQNTKTNTPVSNTKTETVTNVNRKRKSESPDEIQKKLATNSTVYGSMTVTARTKDKIIAKAMNTSEIGTNTSPVHKRDPKKASQYPMLQINPMEAKVKGNEQKAASMPQLIRINNDELSEGAKEEERLRQMIETEKLKRNTVFPQARGRVLNDKVDVPNAVNTEDNVNKEIPSPAVIKVESGMQTDIQNALKSETNNHILLRELLSKANVIINETDPKVNETITKENEANVEIVTKQIEFYNQEHKTVEKMEVDAETSTETSTQPSENISNEMKTNDQAIKQNAEAKETKTSKSTKQNKKSPKKEEKQAEIAQSSSVNECKVSTSKSSEKETNEDHKKEKEYKNISSNEMSGKEIHMVNGNIVKEEKSYILTHVLDGYVIQESNVPFAIRKPLKERTINKLRKGKEKAKETTEEASSSTVSATDNKTLEEGVDTKENVSKINKDAKENILEISQLHLNEFEAEIKKEESVKEEEKENLERINKDNPFAEMKSGVVKAWTADDLSSHLQKFNWTETLSILREHEIDGESLFLVSASQLAHIGVSETHANLICEFVSNKER